MNEGLKDKGLKRAIKEQPQFRLSTNFTFRTMQKVEEAARLHEKKIENRTKNIMGNHYRLLALTGQWHRRSDLLFGR